jgi:cell fate regulator YaaT (PSP1 superfamily)
VRLQLKKNRIREDSEQIRTLLRKASEKEIEKFEEVKAKENPTLERARTIAFSLNLAMKLSDIEFQGDGRKVTFFYTAESRVDFRELIRRYADEFRVKIEMRHISYREEASRLGGIGDCGRQLCCSTWLTDYKMVTTGAARVQNLSINMEKLAGQCGRLKCCLNYELDTYVEAMNEFPRAKVVKLDTVTGAAYSKKIDILKRLMWFAYEDNPNWIPLTLVQVNEIMAQNKEGQSSAALSEISTVAQLAEKSSVYAEAEVIDNDELLKEDREFAEELRRKREQKNKENTDPRNKNRNRDNRNRPDNRRENRPDNRGGNRGDKPAGNFGPKPPNPNQGNPNRPPGPPNPNRNRRPDRRNNRGPGNNNPNSGPPPKPTE